MPRVVALLSAVQAEHVVPLNVGLMEGVRVVVLHYDTVALCRVVLL